MMEIGKGPVDEKFADTWYQGWLDAWNSHDPKTVIPLITEDFILESPTTRHTGWKVQGHDASVKYLAYVMEAYPDLIWERTFSPMFAKNEQRVAYYWRGWGTFSGTLNPPGIKGNGKSFEFSGVEVFDFRDGRACQLRAAYDLLGLMRQIDVYKGWTKSER
jgi:steroid delta-isomerase-like uncharacterized protein